MPELGEYGWHVVSAYLVAILLLNLIAGLSIRRAIRTRRELERLEAHARDQSST